MAPTIKRRTVGEIVGCNDSQRDPEPISSCRCTPPLRGERSPGGQSSVRRRSHRPADRRSSSEYDLGFSEGKTTKSFLNSLAKLLFGQHIEVFGLSRPGLLSRFAKLR